jgi:hypothetical protein
MALPKQVERQIKELEELEKKLAADQEPKVESDTSAPDLKVVESESAQADPIEEPTPSESPEVAEPKAEKPEDDTDWKQKYKTLQGMYDAEVPRLHSQVKELNAELAKLDNQLKQQEAAREEQKAQLAKAEAVARLVTDDDVETFGEDLIEVQRKVAREVTAEFKAELDALKAENASLRESVDTAGTKAAEATFEQKLHRLVPDFEAVNTSKEWINWLNEVDPLIRAPRMTVAQEAYANGDAEAVAHYVQMFKSAQAPAKVVETKVDPAKDVQRQIQPDRSASTANASSQNSRLYSTADIQSMFNKAIKLSNAGKIDEARILEAEIDAAYQSGRVSD